MRKKNYLHKSICIFIFCLILTSEHITTAVYAASSAPSQGNGKFRYDYGVFLSINDSKMKRLKDYQTVVIDAAAFSKKNIQKLKKQGHTVYTYLNVGSLETFRPDYDKYVKYTIAEYKNWENERWVDVSQSAWQKRIAAWAKKYHQKGVDGFFIDNCDVYYTMGLSLDGKAEQKVSSARLFKGLAAILKNLRKTYRKEVIVNGGNAFVQACMKKKYKLSNYLTAVNQENVFTTFDYKRGKLTKSPTSSRKYYLKYLKALPDSVDVFVLEYATSSSLIKTVKKECKKNKFRYYIAESLKLN